MIKGMTGFGQAQLTCGNIKALIEIKSVNHRFLDVNYFLPLGFGSIESKIRQIIQKDLKRGRITVSMKITHKDTAEASLNKDVVHRHLKNINKLKRDLKIKGELPLRDLINLPGVLEVREVFVTPDDIRPAMEKSVQKALKELVAMRRSEGRSLATDVKNQLRRMSMKIKKIRSKARSILSEKKKKLNEEEFRALQRSSDVNEEIMRLLHYIEEIGLLLKNPDAVGKKVDFIAQEMQRETNTIGSKLQDKVVSNAVIALKSKIEKIREQAQNIE